MFEVKLKQTEYVLAKLVVSCSNFEQLTTSLARTYYVCFSLISYCGRWIILIILKPCPLYRNRMYLVGVSPEVNLLESSFGVSKEKRSSKHVTQDSRHTSQLLCSCTGFGKTVRATIHSILIRPTHFFNSIHNNYTAVVLH